MALIAAAPVARNLPSTKCKEKRFPRGTMSVFSVSHVKHFACRELPLLQVFQRFIPTLQHCKAEPAPHCVSKEQHKNPNREQRMPIRKTAYEPQRHKKTARSQHA